ncbi:MAG: hypothetical protein N2971_00990 [Chlorobi bacterium]|nr:hypothetical protein [Chlorobiota bacterium]
MLKKRGYHIPPVPYGVIHAHGKDTIDFLQRLTTNDMAQLSSTGGIRTVLLNEKGRIIDVITCLQDSDRLRIITSPGSIEQVYSWLRRYVILDDVVLSVPQDSWACIEIWDLQPREGVFAIFPECVSLIEGQYFLFPNQTWDAQIVTLWKKGVQGEVFSGLIVCSPSCIDTLIQWLEKQGISNLDYHLREVLRLKAGIGQYPNEYNHDYIALEAGLVDFMSFHKGCYIGQEVIERLSAQKKLRYRLHTLTANGFLPISTPTLLFPHESSTAHTEPNSREAVGTLTSVSYLEEDDDGLPRMYGLGYIRPRTDNMQVLATAEGHLLYLGNAVASIMV